MKIEDQVCTVEQAIRLNELGVKDCHYHDHRFKWTKHERLSSGGIAYNTKNWHVVPTEYLNGFGHQGSYHAFNCAELGIALPEGFTTYYSGHLGCWLWQAVEPTDENDFGWKVTHSDQGEYDSEAEARAAALIYCIENTIISAEAINDSLKE